jgi:3-phosphoshikimate 1-carboxyvinyltransferase
LAALEAAGAGVSYSADSVTIEKKELNGFVFDATDCPDLFPPLVVLACNCRGVTTLKGAARLRFKESDRAAVLEKEFTALGAKIETAGDLMKIEGTKLAGGLIDSHNDHRIAMAAALAALNAQSEITIAGCEAVAKSYPDFFTDFARIGGNVYE